MPGDILDNQGRGEASWSWPSVHPEGRKFGAIAGAIALVGWIALGPLVGLPLVLLTYCVLAFFRDPVRVTPQDDRFIVATLIHRQEADPAQLTEAARKELHNSLLTSKREKLLVDLIQTLKSEAKIEIEPTLKNILEGEKAL